MTRLAVRLDPRRFANPDLDLRYVLPELLAERSGGVVRDEGYEYAGALPFLVLFLSATSIEQALACVIDVIENERVMENELRSAAVVAVEQDGGYEVVHPAGHAGPFLSGIEAEG